MTLSDDPHVVLSFAEWDMIVNALQFSENTYDVMSTQLQEMPYGALGEAYSELRIKLELFLEYATDSTNGAVTITCGKTLTVPPAWQ